MASEETRRFSWLVTLIKIIDKYGVVKMVFGCIMMLFISCTTYLAMNPQIIFEKYREYEENMHSASFNYRMEKSPIVQTTLENLLYEAKGDRCFIIELHNGKYNSAGLSFNYGSLTYEALADSIESIREDYSDFTLERYPITLKVYNEGLWRGTIDDLSKIDRRLALKMEANDAKYLAVASIYGKKDQIGFIGITYTDTTGINKENITNILTKFSSKVSPLLDGENIKTK